MAELPRSRRSARVVAMALLAAGFAPGCAMVPRDRFDESQRLTRSLRAENAHLKDRVLALEGQNQDYADRALDDLRRLTARDEAIDRLEKSVRGYQDDRDRLASAYRRMALGLGRTSEDSAVEPTADRRQSTPEPGEDRSSHGVASGDDGDDSSRRPDPSAGDSGP